MKALIRNVLLDECRKHIQWHFEYLEELHDYTVRKSRREGKQFRKTIYPRRWWNLHPGFNPFKVRSRRKLATYSFTIAEKIRRRQYRPQPCVRYPIPKDDGSLRPLNIFQLPDSAVSRLVYKSLLRKNVARFSAHSYAYREDKTPHHAVTDIFLEWRDMDRVYVAEYDFSRFFDEISHDYLFGILEKEQFTVSRDERHVIEAFLRSESAELNSYPQAATPRQKGIPQGTSVSLFLANVACWELDRSLERLGVGFARYADDTVVWSDDYSRVVRAYYVIDECAAKMGVPINLLKSKGINLVNRSGRREEIETKVSIDYLGYEISLGRISINKKRILKIKSQISYLIYQNLLQPLKKGIFNLPRITGSIDLDYLTALRQVRSYLYGGLTDDKLRSYLAGRTPELRFRGLMSYYPVVSDIEQLRKLDGWIAHTFRQALRVRERLWSARSNVSLPGPEPNWIERIDSLQTSTLVSGETVDLRLPSFILVNRAMRLAISRRGLNAVANPASRYYTE